VIVSQSLAHQYFSGQDAVGKRIKTGLNLGNETPLRQIIGVVGDVRRDSLTDNPPPAIYMPDNQLPRGGTRFVVCSSLPPQALADTMREAVGSVDKKLPVYEMKTLDQYLGLATAQQRFNALVLGCFAMLAVGRATTAACTFFGRYDLVESVIVRACTNAT